MLKDKEHFMSASLHHIHQQLKGLCEDLGDPRRFVRIA
jgi:hypothetical protein